MKTVLPKLLTTLILTLASISFAQAATFNLDPAHSDVGFSVKHLMISNVKGRFDKVTGSFNYDSAKKQIKDVVIDIEVASVNTNEPDRDKHLRSPDFFDAAKFPKMTFKSEKVDFDGKKGQAVGTLTIKGKSNKVTLDFTFNGETQFMGTTKVAFTATTQIDRTQYGLTWNKPLDKAGGVAVSNDVMITIDGEANMASATKK